MRATLENSLRQPNAPSFRERSQAAEIVRSPLSTVVVVAYDTPVAAAAPNTERTECVGAALE